MKAELGSDTSSGDKDAGSVQAGSGGGLFPTTQWNMLQAVHDCSDDARNGILSHLIGTYWKPLFYYARRKGKREEDAKDLVQGFFLACVERDFFAKADRKRARFRTFLRTSFDHYMSNVRRADAARRRYPAGGLVSLDELMANEEDRPSFEPQDDESPADVFNRVWAGELVHRVLKLFREECGRTGKMMHCRIFELRIIEPNLEGTTPPSLEDLASKFGETPKQIANRLLTARRAFQRLLRVVIRTYAFSEDDVSTEIRDLMHTFM